MSKTTPDTHADVLPHPAGHRGTLRTPTGHELPVQTYERGEDVVLVVLGDLGEPPSAESLDPALLEYTSARGVVRLQGEARFEDRSLVRFRPGGHPEVVQRRAFVRVHTPQAVRLGSILTVNSTRTRTIDISGGGMLLPDVGRLRLQDLIEFELRLGDDPLPVEGIARVVRIDADERRALAFEQIDEADRQRLIRFLFACLRVTLAKTRGDLV